MSWSVNLIGHPLDVIAELHDYSTKQTGASKVEFDAALPHLTGLLAQNFSEEGVQTPTVMLAASVHGWVRDGKPVSGNLGVELKVNHFQIAKPR